MQLDVIDALPEDLAVLQPEWNNIRVVAGDGEHRIIGGRRA